MGVAENHDPRVYRVKKTTCGLGSALLEDDIVISIDGKLCTNWADFGVTSSSDMRAVIMRQGSIKALDIHTTHVDTLETDRCIEFCGAYIQRPHLAVRHCLDALPSEVYVTFVIPGSPADRYSLPPQSLVTMINGRRVGDFDSFVDVARCLSEDRTGAVFTVMATTITGTVVKLAIRQNNDFNTSHLLNGV
ncbi:Pro-apoptotic serine protease NMA111 [Metarhizium anisopliae]